MQAFDLQRNCEQVYKKVFFDIWRAYEVYRLQH